jgi:Fe2+ transport system protein FeoA
MQKSKSVKTLNLLERGRWGKITAVPHGILRAQFVRLGIHEGERVKCLEHLPGGTVVIQKNRQQIALGNQLAKQIHVIEIA